MAVISYDHITSPIVFYKMYLFFITSDVKKTWFFHDCSCRLKYSIFRSMYTNRLLLKFKYTPAVRSKISSKFIFASCVWYSDRAHYELCVLIKDIGRGLPLELQCSYQGQQDNFSQSVRGNYKTRFWGGQNLTAVRHIYDRCDCRQTCAATGHWFVWLRGAPRLTPNWLVVHLQQKRKSLVSLGGVEDAHARVPYPRVL